MREVRDMIIGVPKEIKNNEYRVGIVPSGVHEFELAGHTVLIEKGAGLGSGITDAQYTAAGAQMTDSAQEIYARSDMILKVKEPQPAEYGLLRKEQVLFTFLHLAPDLGQTQALMASGCTAIAFETVQLDNGSLPLLSQMSEVAGRMSVQIGAHFLEKQYGGSGVLLGGVPGVQPGKVAIVGGGTVGTNAAMMAAGLGAQVSVLETSIERMRYLQDIFMGRVQTIMSNAYNIAREVREADLLIGAVLIPGARAPKLVTEKMVAGMKKGSVIVDVAIDQGGSIETIDRVTTHSNPVYEKHGVLHYAVANIPGSVAHTSTYALANSVMPYALALANKGWERAAAEDTALRRGVNITRGSIVYQAVAEAHGLGYSALPTP
jgi:alanine dehydrogenase